MKVIIFSIISIFLFVGSLYAKPSGKWMCVAIAEKVLGSSLECDATGFNRNKKEAENFAVEKCNKDCPTKCDLELCIYIKSIVD